MLSCQKLSVILAIPAALAVSGCGSGRDAGGRVGGEAPVVAESDRNGTSAKAIPESAPRQAAIAPESRPPAVANGGGDAASVVRGEPAWTGTDDEARQLIATTLEGGQSSDPAAAADTPQRLTWLAETPRSGPLAAAYMPDDCFGVVVVRPQRLMGSALYQQAVTPEELEQAKAKAPIDPQSMEELVLWLAPPDATDKEIGNIGGAAVRFTRAPTPEEFQQFTAGVTGTYSSAAIHQPDERTILCGSQFRLYKLLTGRSPPARLSSGAVQSRGDVVALVDSSDGQLIQRVAELLPPDNPDAQGMLFGAALFLAPFANSDLIELNLDLSGENLLALRSECKTPQDAVNFQQMITGMILQARQQPQMTPEAGQFFDQLKITAEGTVGTVALPASAALTEAILDGLRQVRSALPAGTDAATPPTPDAGSPASGESGETP